MLDNVFECLREKISEIEDALEVLENTKIIVNEINLYVKKEKELSHNEAKEEAYKDIYFKGCELLQKKVEPEKSLNELINIVSKKREKYESK
jgi:hypothetical protein